MGDRETLRLRHPDGETPIHVGAGVLAAAGELVGDWLAGRTVFVVSSERLLALHGARLAPLRRRAGRVVELAVEDGEGAKTVAWAERLWQRMLAAGGKRDSRLVAFGGGTVGDLGGFVAGAFLRGIEVGQVPTTLLAQVDAAIGGKTGVDLPAGKNAVGLFHHPAWVIADPELLATLDRRDLAAGLVEVVKMAFLLDPPLLATVERDLDRLLAADPAALALVVAAAAAAKCRVVEDDPREGDRRRLLNFGHTLGHAVESALGYRHLCHGEAVAHGLRFALRLGRRRGLPAADAARFTGVLDRLDVPPLPRLAVDELVIHVARDKKAREDGVVWVLPVALGEARLETVGEDELRRELAAFLAGD